MDLLKKLIYGCTVLAIMMGTGACKAEEDTPTLVVAGNYSQELAELFPSNEGAKWEYYGIADYGHHMTLDKIYEANSQKVLKITGEVEDLSGGASQLDYHLEVTYAIESDRVVQTKLSDTMMDSEYDHLTLIMTPLAVGTKWQEETVDSQGKKAAVTGEIIEIEQAEDGPIYKVRYTEAKSDYSEVRKLQKGKGVIDFVKTLKYDDQTVEVSYHLYRMGQAEVSNQEAENKADIDRIKGVIFKFDELWIDFVNQGDAGIKNYIVSGSPVEEMVKNYVRDDTKQKYLSIEIGEITIEGDRAQAKVYEKMQQTKGENSDVLEYRWIYHLIKSGQQWYIHSYEEDKGQ